MGWCRIPLGGMVPLMVGDILVPNNCKYLPKILKNELKIMLLNYVLSQIVLRFFCD